MVIEASTVATLGKVLAPFMKSVYDGMSTKAKVGFEVWKTSCAVEMASNYHCRLSQVKTIWTRGDSIAIEDFYYSSKLIENGVVKKIDSIDDILSHCFVVQGVVGQGKSIFMRYLALSAFKKAKLEVLPIFVELKDITDQVSLKSLICDELRSIGLEPSDQVLESLLKKNKISLLVDGFDEVSATLVSRTIKEITSLRTKYPKLRIGISSRPDNAIQRVPGFVVLPILPLDQSDYDPFLDGLGVDTLKRHSLVIAIQDSPVEIREVMSTPLMLSVVVIIYETYSEIPSYLSEFFNALFHVVFTEHDRKKIAFDRKHYSGLPESELQHLFEAFCYTVMRQGHGRTLELGAFNECYQKAQSYLTGRKCSVEDFKKDIVGVACLMLDEGVGLTTFLHKGILDYFSAAFIKRMELGTIAKFYSSSIKNYAQWKYSIGFLAKIDDYRYSKFFELGPIKQELDAVTTLLEDREVDDLVCYINNGLRSLLFNYEADGRLTMNSIRDPSLRHELLESVRYFIYLGCPLVINDYLSLKGLDASADSLGSGGVQYGLKQAIELAGVDSVWESLGELQTELATRVYTATRLVADREVRMQLLDMEFDDS